MASQQAKEKRVRKFDTAGNKDNRMGVHWAPEENIQLLAEVGRGIGISEIAEIHKRSISAIEIHLSKLAAKECSETGSAIPQAATKYRVTESMINREIKYLQQAKAKKETKEKPLGTDERVAALEAKVAELEKVVLILARDSGIDPSSAPQPSPAPTMPGTGWTLPIVGTLSQ